jgi:tRNA-dihydrouridine synthase
VQETPRHDRWVINKVRALCSWYTKGLDNGSHLRIQVNSAESLAQLRDIIACFFELGAPVPDRIAVG